MSLDTNSFQILSLSLFVLVVVSLKGNVKEVKVSYW